MLLSIANAAPRNAESVRVNELFPPAIHSDASELVALLEYYYDYLNTNGMPSAEIALISSTKDIDVVSEKYLTQIEELIGKNVPNSRVLNKVELYKLIVGYYNTRGSDDSVHTFFKIFFDQLVELIYPKDLLFKASEGMGTWASTVLTDNSGPAFVREQADVSAKTLGGTTYSAIGTNGIGNLISVRYKDGIADSYEIDAHLDNGIVTVTPGLKSTLDIGATSIDDGIAVYPIASTLYFSGFGIDDKPSFSEQINYVTPFPGSPTRVEWDGTKWDFIVGSALGDVFAFYSFEDVDDPFEVTTWINGWELTAGVVAGSIDSIAFGDPTNGQIFNALLNVDGFSEIVAMSADDAEPEWTAGYDVTPRTYLTNDPLPTDSSIEPDRIAFVNGATRPYVIGNTSFIDGEIVWEFHSIDSWSYENTKSFASNADKIFDGRYWQDYSYVIKSDLDSSAWYDQYLKFVHPAGLQMFSAIAVLIVAKNEWNNPIDYFPEDLHEKDLWLKALVPPARLDSNSISAHSPKYQPGYIRDFIFRYIFEYLIPAGAEDDLVRAMFLTYRYVTEVDVRNAAVRAQWQASEKFTDQTILRDGLLNLTIEDLEAEYSNTNSARRLNVSMILGQVDFGVWELAYFDEEEGEGEGEWSGSSTNETEGAGEGEWGGSSVTPL